MFENASETIYEALSAIPGTYNVYELTAGTINLSSSLNVSVKYPAFYLTNFSDFESLNLSMFYAVEDIDNFSGVFLNKEKFAGGVVSICYVMSGLVTASWMLFLLLLFSANTIPNSLILANLFHATCHTKILTKLSSILRHQVKSNFSDIDQVQMIVTFSTATVILKGFATLFIYISWIDLVIQMNKYGKKNQIIWIGLTGSLISTAFQVAYGFLFDGSSGASTSFKVIEGFYFAFSIFMVFCLQWQVLKYSFKKTKFAYHKKALPLALFTWMVLMVPYVFSIIDIASDTLRTWSTYVTVFGRLCISVVLWEWLHAIKMLEKRNERKTVLGRRLSNDSFTSKFAQDSSSQNSYLLKSLNIVALFTELKCRFKNIYSAQKRRKEEDVVLSYELAPTISRQSLVSEPSAVSLVGDYPEFNVDHRYLRNTPSTNRNTPDNQ